MNICVQIVNVKKQGSFVSPLAVRNTPFHYQSAQRFHAAVKVYRSLSDVQQARLEAVDFLRLQGSRSPRDDSTPLPYAWPSPPQPLPCGAASRQNAETQGSGYKVRYLRGQSDPSNQGRIICSHNSKSTARYLYGGERIDRSLPRPSVNPGFTMAFGSPRSIAVMVPLEIRPGTWVFQATVRVV